MAMALITHPVCQQHAMHPGHPECPQRLTTMMEVIEQSAFSPEVLNRIDAESASWQTVALAHDASYVQSIKRLAPDQGLVMLDGGDTAMNRFSLDAGLRAAGAVCQGARLVETGAVQHVFCAVRPCGHHATKNQAMGFCFFNGIAIGAAYALAELGLERVAILDFDVHHGNGTEDIFFDDPRVLFCSSFQHPFYPYSSAHSERAHIVKTPMPAQSDGELFRQLVRTHWLPALERFKPQMIFVSAGFDAHREDPLGQLNLLAEDYAWFTQRIVEVADQHCPGRIVSMLEGGYHWQATAASACHHIAVLAGQDDAIIRTCT